MNSIAWPAWRQASRLLFLCFAALCLGWSRAAGGGGGSAAPGVGAGGPRGGHPAPKAKWTYLVYMAADNTLSEMASFNVAQMKAAQSSADVRVVVQMEQSKEYSANVGSETLRGTVSGGTASLRGMGRNVDMADKQSLSEFIKWGKQAYPADRYAVVLWSHGGGWKADKTGRGALQDLSSGTGMMSIKDVAWALQDAGGVDLLNFDACLMAMYEVAYELRHSAKVLVASEEVIPGTGNPYDKVINRLVANPAQDAAALGTGIVADYDAYYRAKNRDSVTLSAIDLGRMDSLHAKVQESAGVLAANLAAERLNIEAARAASAYYQYVNNHDLIAFATDLSTRASSAAVRAKAAELAAAARAAVLSSKVLSLPGSTVAGSSGLAIFLPAAPTTSTAELGSYKAILASNAAAAAPAMTWSDFVTPLVTGSANPGQTVGSGAFAYGIEWDNPDVDLDLLVNEPQGNWAGPAEGTTSVNSFSSADSYDSGEALETYTGNDQLEKGAYDVFVRYAGCHRGIVSCGSTTVTVFRYDPSRGDTQPVRIGSRVMASTPALDVPFSPFSSFINAVSSDQYADWLYAQRTSRALPAVEKVVAAERKQVSKALRAPVQK